MRIALVVIALTATAHADDDMTFLNVGAIVSASTGTHSMAGAGFEATLTKLDGDFEGWGGFVQAETGGPPFATASHLLDDQRFGAGLIYVHGFYGVEVGPMFRTAKGIAPTFGGQVGAFLTAGVMSLELRAGIALPGPVQDPHYGSDIGLVIATKVPMQVGGKAFAIKDVSLLPCIWRCKPARS
ncbi:MAG TPA: hypothetical protein VGO00_10935 [Kofleriaceae bacterium]|jgi:hypothetical protein|nr:hypothetical protein [Kofleriaceae bacterium]